MPILCSMEPQDTWFGCSAPSASGRSLGTRNSEIPWTPAGAPSSRARTGWTELSALCGAPGGNEDLVPGDCVAAIGLFRGLGAEKAKVGAAVRLGEAHDPGPFAADQLGEIGIFEHRRRVIGQRRHGALREERVHRESEIGGT